MGGEPILSSALQTLHAELGAQLLTLSWSRIPGHCTQLIILFDLTQVQAYRISFCQVDCTSSAIHLAKWKLWNLHICPLSGTYSSSYWHIMSLSHGIMKKNEIPSFAGKTGKWQILILIKIEICHFPVFLKRLRSWKIIPSRVPKQPPSRVGVSRPVNTSTHIEGKKTNNYRCFHL